MKQNENEKRWAGSKKISHTRKRSTVWRMHLYPFGNQLCSYGQKQYIYIYDSTLIHFMNITQAGRIQPTNKLKISCKNLTISSPPSCPHFLEIDQYFKRCIAAAWIAGCVFWMLEIEFGGRRRPLASGRGVVAGDAGSEPGSQVLP